MKQNKSFLLKELAEVPYLLPYGQMIADHKHGLKTNATGVYLWNLLEQEHSLEEVLTASAAYYEIPIDGLAEFREEITGFIELLKKYNLIIDSAVDASEAVFTKLKSSRKEALIQKSSAENTAAIVMEVCQKRLSIGGIQIAYTGPAKALPPDFNAFIAKETDTPHIKAAQEVFLHPDLPSAPPCGQVLLQDFELNIIEQEDGYLLHFPQAKQHLEIHLDKDGLTAHCYSLPPYTSDFHYDFFHALRLAYLYLAQRHHMVAIHSASILYRDRLWLFSGHSGMGKSTHTNLWKEIFHTPVINGDLNLLAVENGKPVVHGIPWCGTSKIYDTKTYPLGGIILLNRSANNYTEELSTDHKQLLVSQRLISPTWTKELWEKNLSVVEQVTKEVLVCKLCCTKEPQAAEAMKNAIDTFLDTV